MRTSLLLLFIAAAAFAQDAGTLLINGKIVTGDAQFSIRQALAVRDGKIAAVGTNAEARKAARPNAKVIDLHGRTVIPGLIDSHMHAIRAASFFATEVNWTGVRSLSEAMQRIRTAAAARKAGAWLIVGGGWKPEQFKENRMPTQAELTDAAGEHPAYVQYLYSSALLNPRGFEALNLKPENDQGTITKGVIALFDRLPRPTLAEQIEGTKLFFHELNRLGITGVSDPCGNNVTPSTYDAINRVWRDKQLTVRVAYSICGFTPGHELEDFKTYLGLMPMGFGDDMMHFNGIGEQVLWSVNNVEKPPAAELEKLYEIAKWAAGRGYTMTFHCNSDAAVGPILDVFERVNRETPITGLRWSIAHLNDGSAASLRRMKVLGMGWTMQDAMYFSGNDNARMPPIETARELGVPIGAGTDAHRVASYNPFTALEWALDAKTVGGKHLAGDVPSRANALRFYSIGSAWFSHDETKRGSLEVGKFADLAVLSKDYLTASLEEIGGIESELTMVGGNIVYVK
jgi:predicted amidohydrolase YtcJ